MAKFTTAGVLITVAIFLFLFSLILSLVQVDNPLQGQETSIMKWFIDIVIDSIIPW